MRKLILLAVAAAALALPAGASAHGTGTLHGFVRGGDSTLTNAEAIGIANGAVYSPQHPLYAGNWWMGSWAHSRINAGAVWVVTQGTKYWHNVKLDWDGAHDGWPAGTHYWVYNL